MTAHIRILYDGKLALTIAQAAQRYNLAPDAMRQAINRFRRAGLIAELPESLDGRKLYPAAALDKAMKARPGKGGRNVQPRRRKAATTVPGPRPPADYVPYGERKPYTVANSLDDLCGPTSGIVTLPHHIDWSGSPNKNLDIPGMLGVVYETVLNEASTTADLNAFLNREALIELWPTLWLPPKVRRLWHERFPDLTDLNPVTL